jgi:hypothetical protein
MIHLLLGNNGASPERSNLLQFISPEDVTMSKIDHLLQQAARAELLAKNVLDKLTIERLQAFATDCRVQARMLAERRPEAA